ncbi:DUF2272 domain-containing protein [Lysobacter sp. CFH 32150]|uniref:DUF2272 domain-containing protein n=1 Tax=Lysobacter sp. CFH 32150 TaxID=2927128 RepID=UPI001FA7D013|nr:DUF2272 domain-containing protein [Lysobacter sp. CFH 32150]MCI4566404.1 DUF2272 domain-containing protein [Lysobacter sp. CFH 32150]
MEVMHRLVLAGILAWTSTDVDATGACGAASGAGHGERIATIACNENTLWFSPFIDTDGHLASTKVAEGETSRLNDGMTPAWKRVVEYWKGSGLLWRMTGTEGASDCAYPVDDRIHASSCRAFVIDTPWSAAFVSYVMARAGVPGFRPSASHIDFVRDAYLRTAGSPFQFSDPDIERPGVGDLLCFSRSSSVVFGHQGLKDFLDRDPHGSLDMHCEVVVAANPGGNGKVHLVGGNVLQGVTMRELHVNRNGLLWSLPRRFGIDTTCSPDNGKGCSFNRQDWVALLKLNPALATPRSPQPATTPATRPPTCCLKCAADVAPGIPRC